MDQIPKINKRFKVTFQKSTDCFIGKIISIDKNPENSNYKYKISQIKRRRFDVVNRPYYLPNSTIQVEEKWFDSILTGRIIKPFK